MPRTLALSLYGDLDMSVLDELPPGRTPIVTRRVPDERCEEVWDFIRKQVKLGRQPGARQADLGTGEAGGASLRSSVRQGGRL
jgi:hypothetical protein